jgi:hypothetical protein
MSYCRWSSDHFDCDVYVYEDVSGGWTTHVAGRRRRNPLPDEIRAMYPDDWRDADAVDRYMAAQAAAEAWLITQPHDEYVMNYAQPDGTTKPGVYRSLKDSEYFDLAEIGPEAGTTANHPSPGECADYLEMLKGKGFNVPQYAIDALREEAGECSPSSDATLNREGES